MNYYEILGVSIDSSQIDIKKAYHKQAIIWHPDKNNNSEESKQKFQQISEAYQVLHDIETRKEYDIHGKTDMKMKSANELFSELFSNVDPVISKFLKSTFGDIKSRLDNSDKLSIWDLFTTIDKDKLIEEGGNVVKHILKQSLCDSDKIPIDKKYVYDLELDIDSIDSTNSINITIDCARRFTHINLLVSKKDIKHEFILDMSFEEHIINFLGKKYIFYLEDSFPTNYKRWNEFDLVLEKNVFKDFDNLNYNLNNEYETDNVLDVNICLKNNSNIIKIPSKGLLNKKTKKFGNLFIILFFSENVDDLLKPVKNEIPIYDTISPYEIISNI